MSKKNQTNNPVYFGTTGLSSTAAEHLTHVATDLIANAKNRLENITFINKSVSLIGDDKFTVLSKGSGHDELDVILERDLNEVILANSFIAWVREAIKTKEAMIEAVDETDLDEWIKEHHPEADVDFDKTIANINRYVSDNTRTPESYLDELNIKELNRYFTLEARAAALGKLIHNNGYLRKALNEVLNAEVHPHETRGSGRDMTVESVEATVTSDYLQKMLANLQCLYRDAESQLNKVKYENKTKAEANNRALRDKKSEVVRKVAEQRELYRLERDNWVSLERERVANLKIVIPDELKDFVEQLKEHAKQ